MDKQMPGGAKFKNVRVLFLLWLAVFFTAGCAGGNSPLLFLGTVDRRISSKDEFVFINNENQNFGKNFSFLVLSDVHIQGNRTRGLESLKFLPTDCFAVITGDITDGGGPTELDNFVEIAGRFPVPCYPVIGNHDIYFGNWKTWRSLLGSSCYRVDSPGTSLFILDSANGHWGERQLAWLEAELKTAEERLFVFTHYSLFLDPQDEDLPPSYFSEREKLFSLLNGRCDAVFMGHTHGRDVREIQGTVYITMEDFRDSGTYCRVFIGPEGLDFDFLSLR